MQKLFGPTGAGCEGPRVGNSIAGVASVANERLPMCARLGEADAPGYEARRTDEREQDTHTFKCAAYNLGFLLRKVLGLSKPRNWADRAAALFWAFLHWLVLEATILARLIGRRIRPIHAIFQGYSYRWVVCQELAAQSSIKINPFFNGLLSRAAQRGDIE